MAIALVQSTKATLVQGNSAALTVSKTFGSNTTAGSLLVAIGNGLGAPASATMTTAGIVWTAIGLNNYGNSNPYISIYYCFNASSVSSATNNTFATNASTNSAGLTLYEFSGLGIGSLDVAISNSIAFAAGPTTVTPNPGSLTAAGAGELIICTEIVDYATNATFTNPTINGSFTAGQVNVPVNITSIGQWAGTVDEYLLSSASGANATTYGNVTVSTSFILWAAQAVAFKTAVVVVVPTVTTQAASAVTATTATGNGNITSLGGAASCSAEGFVYDSVSHGAPGNVAPGSSGYASFVTQSGSFGTGAFTETISGLSAGVTYFVRAWAQNVTGYGYGAEVSFTAAGLGVSTFTFNGLAW